MDAAFVTSCHQEGDRLAWAMPHELRSLPVISVDAFAGAAAAHTPLVPELDTYADARLVIVEGHHRASRELAARQIAQAWASGRPDAQVWSPPRPHRWPFLDLAEVALPASARIAWIPDLHDAFTSRQTEGTRLVTTQPSYVGAALATWRTRLPDLLLLATADGDALRAGAPEIADGHGVFADARVPSAAASTIGGDVELPAVPETPAVPNERVLERALRTPDAAERLTLCVQALDLERTPGALLTTGSTCMEVNDLASAEAALHETITKAPGWAAARFELGKLRLRQDDMEGASRAFLEATELLPTFVGGWANLGATYGELDRPDEALRAFEQARTLDPLNAQTLNNIGVVSRELGRLADSERAFREVTRLAPDLAFGYYNLGHTFFLQGRYQAAMSAYVSGQSRDPERNAVQASRLALCRLATGDGARALRDLKQAVARVPATYRRDLLSETNVVLWALLTDKPGLPGWAEMNGWLQAELAK